MRARVTLIETTIALCLGILCALVAAQTLGYWNVSIGIPAGYDGDGLFYDMLIKGVTESGWYLNNPLLGAPFGLDMGPFMMVDDTHFAIIKALGQFTDDFGSTATLFLLVSYATAAISAFLVMRLLGINRTYSAVDAFLYALQSYHFTRGGGHLFLSSYFSAPIFVGIALALYQQPELLKHRKITFLAITMLLFVATSAGVYYAFFGSILIGFSSFAASCEQKRWQPILLGAAAGVVILLSTLVSLGPHFSSIHQHVDDQVITNRMPSESELYGLRFTQMALPSIMHRQSEFREISQRYQNAAPNVNENSLASLGMIALAGFLLSILVVLVRFRSDVSIQLRRLGTLNMVAFCYATIGGLGSAFAWLVTAQFRGLNRISILIAFISLCALLLWLQALGERLTSSKVRALLTAGVASALILLGFWDQAPDKITYPYTYDYKIRFEKDQRSGKAIQGLLGKNARVYQLPYVSFPEAPAQFHEGIYGLSRRYLHTHEIAWSYGAMRGRESDQWIQKMEALALPERLSRLAASEFDAVLVERAAYKDAGQAIEKQISELIGAPALICPDQSCAMFLLSKSANPSDSPLLLAVRGSGFQAWQRGKNGDMATRSIGNDTSRFFLLNPTRKKVKASFRFEVTAERNSTFSMQDGKRAIVNEKLDAGQPHTG